MDPDQYPPPLHAASPDNEEDVGTNAFVQDLNSAHHHHEHTFSAREDLSIDPALNGHLQEQHHHDAHIEHYEQQMPRQLYAAGGYALHTPSEHGGSGHFSSPAAQGGGKIAPAYTPGDRELPDKRVTDETIDDAYVTFIMYCNPSVPLDCDTAELRKVFRQPPKSDGKTFNVYLLLQLIEKLERKEVIKTWTKLATELGVEKTPDSSAQKVQQYAVRLKVCDSAWTGGRRVADECRRGGCMLCTWMRFLSIFLINRILTTSRYPPLGRMG